jgi:transcriptional regulator GlxA family with amidase domain
MCLHFALLASESLFKEILFMQDPLRSGGTALDATPIPSPNQNPDNKIKMIRERRLLKVIQSMESHLPHSVRELAQQVHLSPDHLQRLFKQETGVHISGLLCARRLDLAAELLMTTDMEIKQIAYFVGYGHHSSFVRAFQRRFGQPPKRYRKRSA